MARRCALALTLLAACQANEPEASPSRAEPSSSPSPVATALDELREREDVLVHRPVRPWSEVSGPDPVDVLAWGGEGFVGLLRGSSAVVRLDAAGRELQRIEAPAGAVGWAHDGGRLAVVGERSGDIALFSWAPEGRLRAAGTVTVEGVRGLRSVAFAPQGGWIVADRHRGRLHRVEPDGAVRRTLACAGALEVVRHGPYVVGNCMLEHRVVVLDADTLAPIAALEHDGPVWSIAARTVDGALELALGGVEDRPLDRSDGAFGYIDSFVFRVRLVEGTLRRLEAVNVAAHGVVTPKHLRWRDDTLWVTGAGSDTLAEIAFEEGPSVRTTSVPAGMTGFAWRGERLLAADPLLDRWVRLEPTGAWSLVDIEAPETRTEAVRLGEALVFTTLMAPQASAQGRGSRFTCETCHFEGTVDGRVHFTGRGEVYATTKTLRGLVGNRPHFSRALDRTSTGMIHNEFRVANAQTPQDPWFALEVGSVPWLGALTSAARREPAQLRGAVLEFLAVFGPERNPATRGRDGFSALQREGARRFEALCEGCHQARTVTDDPDSRVPALDWEADVLGEGRIVWASERRYRTGVEPYVHEDGARVPSLRRLWVKRPYLTQGTAADLAQVLEAVRVDVDAVHGGGEGTPLSPQERRALAAFVELL